jgi:hypothetical protein
LEIINIIELINANLQNAIEIILFDRNKLYVFFFANVV